jgi:hypothetical protein
MPNNVEHIRTGLDEYTQKELTEQEARSLVDLFRVCYPPLPELAGEIQKWDSSQYAKD